MLKAIVHKHILKAASGLLCAIVLMSVGCTQKAAHNGSEQTSASPVQTVAPTPQQTPLPLTGLVIGIDPGHQAKPDYNKEPIYPGSKTSKAKVSAGTRGNFSNVYEYQINLSVGLKLKEILKAYGATVVMTRETNDVNISNMHRAELFNDSNTDYAIRLHCNGKDDTRVNGAFVLIPAANPYLDACKIAAQLLLEAYCEKTGAKSLGITPRSDQTGFNFCNRMIVNIEMGHLSNAKEEQNLIREQYQQKMAQGIADGILRYFGK